MRITAKTLPHSRRQFDVVLTEVETAEHYEQAVQRLAQSVKVAGFRPGKAPNNLLRDQIEPEKLREEAYSLAVRDAWNQIIKEAKETPIEDPAVEILTFDEGQKGELRFAFDVRPVVAVKDIKTIKLTGLKKPPVTDQEISDVLSSLAKGHAKTVIKLTAAQLGDKIEVTFDGYLKNVKQEKLSSKHFPIVLGEQSVIPGFAEQLVGLKKGDQKTFQLKFPADHFDKTLGGQTVKFEVTAEEVFDVQLSKIDDEFGKKFGHDTLAQLKNAIKADLQKERDDEFLTQQKAKWLAEFEKKVTVELPESLVMAEVARARTSWQEFLASRSLEPAAWLTQRGLTMAQLEKDWRTAALTSVTIGLGLAEISNDRKKPLQTNEEYQALLDELVSAAAKTK